MRHAKNSHFCSKKSVSFTENQRDLTGLPMFEDCTSALPFVMGFFQR